MGDNLKQVKKYFLLVLMLLLASLNFNLILKRLSIVTGGTQGLALIISNVLNIETSIIILIINVLMLLLSIIFLDKNTVYGTIVSTFLYPFFVRLTSNINLVFLNSTPLFFLILITAFLCGVTGGIIYKLGFSNGGISLIPLFFKKYLNINIDITYFIMNTLIIILGIFTFGILKSFYSVIVIFINSIIIRLILKRKRL